jgi:hypothetical protein
MNTNKFNINKMRIASPCPAGWESMTGDKQKRFCSLCNLSVYNISEMTTAEVRALVSKSDGRICARIYKRADGTVLTRDCPVGVRTYRKRVSNFAGAIFTAIIGLCSVVFGQTDSQKVEKAIPTKDTKAVSPDSQKQLSGLKGSLTDLSGAVISGATIILQNEDKKITTSSADKGDFNFVSVSSGIYSLEIISNGFKRHIIQAIKLEDNKISVIKVELEPAGEVLIGVIAIPEDYPITTEAGSVKTTITKKVLNKLPF